MSLPAATMPDPPYDASVATATKPRTDSQNSSSPADEREKVARNAKSDRLNPKEHGAYAILGIPLVAALIISGLTPETVLVAIAAVAAFLAHEPLLIISGSRGKRARESTPFVTRTLIVRLSIAVVCGTTAFCLSGNATRFGLIACVVFASLEFVISTGGHNRTLAAQLLGIGGLALPSAVVLLAGGIEITTAVQFWLIWFAGRVATTVSVRSTITRHKISATAWAKRTCDILLFISFLACFAGIGIGSSLWIVTIPMLLAATVMRITTPHPKHMKQIGWSLLMVNILSGVVAIGAWNYF
ncbi:YwiC-like family protein [Thalassoglobus polymorphus]|uniref:1,4-dihydroxy-2-naphthoate octaprenyltransferase n=1 Tax=Thalassoglobus polymorphus TaxID=2527994 RepID=A0A517QUX1_9PLAN|nr:YwiC-like family protein [Thalassoglobus polymorphus]QDT35435.1 hypothetical protein Mal48_47120 [Thalassoglobus polymorphus]